MEKSYSCNTKKIRNSDQKSCMMSVVPVVNMQLKNQAEILTQQKFFFIFLLFFLLIVVIVNITTITSIESYLRKKNFIVL